MAQAVRRWSVTTRISGFNPGPVQVNFVMLHEAAIISAVLQVSERQTTKLEICQRQKCFSIRLEQTKYNFFQVRCHGILQGT